MRLEIYKLDSANFIYASGLACQVALKKKKLKLELLTDMDTLLRIEKGIRSGICHALHRYVKAHDKHMKDYNKNKELSYIRYWDVNNSYG